MGTIGAHAMVEQETMQGGINGQKGRVGRVWNGKTKENNIFKNYIQYFIKIIYKIPSFFITYKLIQ